MAQINLLGSIEVIGPDGPVDLGAPKQRAVLARLALDVGRVVSVDALVDAVWDTSPPSAQASLQVFVSNLRRLLRTEQRAASPIVRQGSGYLLDARPEETDLGRFVAGCALTQSAADSGRWSDALDAADATLALWRGPLLSEFGDREWVRVAAAPVDERHAACALNRVRALLGTDQVNAAVAAGRAQTLADPLAENAVWLYALALHRIGRSADALDAIRQYTRVLDDELALEPGPAVRDLQAGILRQDAGLRTWPPRESPQPTAPPTIIEPPHPDAAGDDFVGRAPELTAAAEVLTTQTHGARWLALVGEAGIGKSRLAEQVVRNRPGTVVRTGCPDDEGVPLWWPVRRLIEEIGADPDTALATPIDADADAARYAVYDAVTRALSAALTRGPLLLLVEDVHWADQATVRLLIHLAGAAADRLTGLAVVITSRPVDAAAPVTRLLDAVSRRPGSRVLPVPPLSSGEVAELASRVSGSELDGRQAVALAMRTGGNPFFVSEYARLPAHEREDGTVPAAIGTVLDRRLAGLDASVLGLLRTAAVIGDVPDVDLLQLVTQLGRDELADLLDEAADHRILVPTPDGTYMFGHSLLREKLLADLGATRRQRIHLEVARAVTSDDLRALGRRASHLVAAGAFAEPADVVTACRAAAIAYERRLEPEPAARWWGHALAAFDRLPDPSIVGVDRDDLVVAQVISLARSGRGQTVLDVIDAALLDAIRRTRFDSVSRLAGTLLRTSGSWPWAAYGSDPAPLLARLTHIEALVHGHPSAHVRVLAALAVGSCYAPDARVPDELSARSLTIAEGLDDPAALRDALLGRALAFSGVAVRAEETLTLLERFGRVTAEADTPGSEIGNHDDVIAHGLAYLANVSLGRLDVAADHVRLGVARSDLLRLSTSRVQFRWAAASLALAGSEALAVVEESLGRAVELHRQTELYEAGTFDIALFGLRWEQGRLAGSGFEAADPRVMPWAAAVCAAATGSSDAAELIARDLRRVEPPLWTTHYRLTMLAHAAADAQARELVPELLDRLAPYLHRVANVGQVSVAGPVALAAARLHALCGDREAAASMLGIAAALAGNAGAVRWTLRCRLLAAQLQQDDATVAAVEVEARAQGMFAVGRFAALDRAPASSTG